MLKKWCAFLIVFVLLASGWRGDAVECGQQPGPAIQHDVQSYKSMVEGQRTLALQLQQYFARLQSSIQALQDEVAAGRREFQGQCKTARILVVGSILAAAVAATVFVYSKIMHK